MVILGVSDSHEAHACIVKDGKIIAAMAEERLTRLKSDVGYPKQAIDAVLRIAKLTSIDIDVVAFAGRHGNAFQRVNKMNAMFSVGDWINQQKKYWYPKLIKGENISQLEEFNESSKVIGSSIVDDPYYPFIESIKGKKKSEYDGIFNRLREDTIIAHLGIDRDKIKHYRHEDCHKIYGYYSNVKHIDKVLVLTLEGGGDDSSATVSIIDNGRITEYWKSNNVMLGRLYRYITLILGMLPSQHEYKVMGLAPYGSEYHGKKSLEYFRTIDKVVGPEIHNVGVIKDMYYSARNALEGERFDGIAWGLQTYLEEILTKWVSNCVDYYKINNVIFSGGVAQNIKACKKIIELPELETFWTGPISGDGSLGIGAAWLSHQDNKCNDSIEGLKHIYLGTSHSDESILHAIDQHNIADKFYERTSYNSCDVARWLTEGKIIARFSGRMEFGQRALGNRSIIADPRKFNSVEKINTKVKYRDFWMPFTPTIMFEDCDNILVNPKGIYSPYMTMAFDLKDEYRDVLPAVVHPSDKTVRPQMLRYKDNPKYYDIINEFKKLTGIGVVLNTSFNLHGDAVVESPDDAIQTFIKSELDILLFDNVVISRKVLS
jgi:carbamoyltransferase